jgi:hypothetical protein
MSKEVDRPGQLGDEGFEQQDLGPKAVYTFLIITAVFIIVVYFALDGMYRIANWYELAHQPPPNPMAKVDMQADPRAVAPEFKQKFPEPRLEENERTEMKDYRLPQEQLLNSYGWVDQSAGVMHIPIDRAKQLIAERGLPTKAKAGSVPPSVVNTAQQAAAKSDKSGSKK